MQRFGGYFSMNIYLLERFWAANESFRFKQSSVKWIRVRTLKIERDKTDGYWRAPKNLILIRTVSYNIC